MRAGSAKGRCIGGLQDTGHPPSMEEVLQFYTPTAWQGGGRGPTARQGSGRDLYVNKNKFILRRGPWREPATPLPGGRTPAAPPVGG